MTAAEIHQMPTSEKIRLMEALWQALTEVDGEVVSPEWHGEILAERDRLMESGEEKFMDWELAKKRLREELQ